MVWGAPEPCAARVGTHSFVARAGHHLAPQPLSSGRNVFEELGGGFTLLALDDEDAVCGLRRAADELDVPLKIVRDSRAGARERYEAGYVLVRPDHFVAWAGDDPSPQPRDNPAKSIGAP